MAKKKDHRELEHLRGLNRELVKKVKNLQKQVGRSEKQTAKKIAEYNNFTALDEAVEETNSVTCKKCKSSKLSIIDFNIKTITICLECGFRETKKKEKE